MSHYDTLRVASTADEGQIRAAYLRLARRHHPDSRASGSSVADSGRMRDLNRAWAVLGDPQRRRDYDRSTGLGTAATKPKREWQPLHDDPDIAEEDPRDLIDDIPYGRGSELPSWFQVLPAGLIVLAVFLFAVGMVTGLAPMLALSVAALALGLLSFMAAPLLAVFRGRSAERGS